MPASPASVTTGMPNTTATYYGSPKKKQPKKVNKTSKKSAKK